MVSTSRWKPYPTYKPSGIEWLGEIPDGWKIKRLKFVSRVNMGQSPPSEICNDDGVGLPFLQGNAEFGAMFPDASHYCPSPPKKSEEGDLLLSVRAPVGALNVSDQVYGIGRGLCSITPNRKDANSVFARYLIQVIREELNTVATGSTYEAVSASEVGDLTTILPPLPEQQAIASFLDRQTAKIDELIAKKQRLIELLEEKRTAVISHAVTKGLNPNVKTKPSGIPWLGEIPEHWEVRRLKYTSSINIDSLSDHTDPDYILQYVDIGNVDSFGNVDGVEEMIFEDAPSRARRKVKDGDTIISTVRTYLKAISFMQKPPDNRIVSTGFAVITPSDKLLPKFLWRMVQSKQFVDSVMAHSEGVSYPAINPSLLGCLPINLPPLLEQQAIASFFDRETAKIDELIAKVREGIDRLTEYCTALISAAVTGKIDVREAV